MPRAKPPVSPPLSSRASSARLSLRCPAAEFVHKHARILAVIDRYHHEVNAAGGEGRFQRRNEFAGGSDAVATRSIGFRVLHEIGISERHAEVGEPVDRLLPA